MGANLSALLESPCHLQPPSAANAIDFSKDVRKFPGGESLETGRVLCTVDESTCKLTLTRFLDKHGYSTYLEFFLHDDVHLKSGIMILFKVTRSATGSLPKLSCFPTSEFESAASKKTNRTVNARGGFTETTSQVYGRSGNRGGLLVVKWKKNSKDEPFTTLTLAHYFAFKKSTETDIGFSVVVKVRAYNDGKLDVTMEGPEQHPAFSLLYMFDEVVKTGIWKPTMCFHCVQHRKHLSRMLSQDSDTEDSDGVPVPPRRDSRQKAITVSNNGRFRDGNGNYIENYMNFRR